jgi:hypothetical protein
VNVKQCKVDADSRAGLQFLEAELVRVGFGGEAMSRSLEQNDLFHVRNRACKNRWNELVKQGREGFEVLLTEETMKELLLLGFGNKRLINLPGGEDHAVAMRTSKYKATPADLTERERRQGFISMQDLITKIEVWAATELFLDLETGETMDAEWWEGRAA